MATLIHLKNPLACEEIFLFSISKHMIFRDEIRINTGADYVSKRGFWCEFGVAAEQLRFTLSGCYSKLPRVAVRCKW